MTARSLDIESTANPRVKAWAALSKRSERDRTNTFLVEGRRETERATEHLVVRELIWCPAYGLQPAVDTSHLTTVSARAFDKVSRRQNPDGVAAVVETPEMSLSSWKPVHPLLVLVGDAIEKPGNLGAMLRSCDAFGAAFIGSHPATDLVNPNVVRAAQGSLFTTPVATASRGESIEWCVENTDVVVAHPGGTESLWDLDLIRPVSIVIGSEHQGVHRSWLESGTAASIPMEGAADSLNASVSGGIFLAEAARQRSS